MNPKINTFTKFAIYLKKRPYLQTIYISFHAIYFGIDLEDCFG